MKKSIEDQLNQVVKRNEKEYQKGISDLSHFGISIFRVTPGKIERIHPFSKEAINLKNNQQMP